ncbi:hypothetical protein BT63DRAFT_458670 [Microthyrium microscopicum]|uniref:Swi5-domain-containing protein n=1 Tax=Microthyrium microscopicum TaxID=703497 RepID=A0A6A6U2G7_9PEZI|nr:hypothetical protein BT63DRAFT_458670 [Microthyrium microscopicum]
MAKTIFRPPTPNPPTSSPTKDQPKKPTPAETLVSLQSERNSLLLSLHAALFPSTTKTTDSQPTEHPTPSTAPTYTSSAAHFHHLYQHSSTTTTQHGLTRTEEEATLRGAKQIHKNHIAKLHAYNAVRDIGQGLIGMVAENRKARVKDCEEEFGIGKDD